MLVAFIRHGESELNRQGVLDGNSEAGLTEQGILQCMQLGQWIRHNLAEEAVIFSSPMRRARESAEYIRTAIAGKIYIDDRLGEAEDWAFAGKISNKYDWDAEIGKSGVESAAHIRRRAYQFLRRSM